MAGCVVRLAVVVMEPDTDAASECPDCGFDSVLDFPVYYLSEVGVGRALMDYRACIRCSDVEDD
jgi:hypothetical protein